MSNKRMNIQISSEIHKALSETLKYGDTIKDFVESAILEKLEGNVNKKDFINLLEAYWHDDKHDYCYESEYYEKLIKSFKVRRDIK